MFCVYNTKCINTDYIKNINSEIKTRVYLFRIEVGLRQNSRNVRRFGDVLVIAEDVDRVLARRGRQVRNIGGSIAIIVALYFCFGWAFDGETKGASLTVCVHCKLGRLADDAGAQTWSESPDVGLLVRTHVDLEGRLGNLLAAVSDHYYVTAFLYWRIVALVSRRVGFGHSKVI